MKFLLIGLLVTFSAFAQDSKEAFCSKRSSLSGVQSIYKDINNFLSFENTAGMLSPLGIKTGVCWWHSRLQRNITYLAHFRPELPRPETEKEINKIISNLISGKEVVIIPGYRNLQEFSIDNNRAMQGKLNAWMRRDSLLNQTWIKGLKGKTSMDEASFQEHLSKIYDQFVESDGLMVQILQFEGITAHAWLVTDIKKMPDGYTMNVIDSNLPNYVWSFYLDNRATSMNTSLNPFRIENRDADYLSSHYPKFVGRVDFQKELPKLKKAVTDYCSSEDK